MRCRFFRPQVARLDRPRVVRLDRPRVVRLDRHRVVRASTAQLRLARPRVARRLLFRPPVASVNFSILAIILAKSTIIRTISSASVGIGGMCTETGPSRCSEPAFSKSIKYARLAAAE